MAMPMLLRCCQLRASVAASLFSSFHADADTAYIRYMLRLRHMPMPFSLMLLRHTPLLMMPYTLLMMLMPY